jgi:hypothetical protein
MDRLSVPTDQIDACMHPWWLVSVNVLLTEYKDTARMLLYCFVYDYYL